MDEIIVTKRETLLELISEVVREELETHMEKVEVSDGKNEVLTNKQAMKHLHVSRSTLQRWRKSGKLPYRKVEGKILYTKSDLNELLEYAAV
ncbi:MAG: helix-turn-helix domain-containing protein [Balneolaceae bacterium]|nr:helix-turn-helix domain-containing protein [Balneolaceae bacterium]